MSNIAGVVLAAGGSSRLGQPKQLLRFRGETLIRRAVRAAADAGCDPVIVVVGETGEAIRSELDIRDSRISSSSAFGSATQIVVVENAEWRNGVGTSIRRGVEKLAESVDAVVLLTCDQPFVDASVIGRLLAEREKTARPVAACRYANTLGVPALFDRSYFNALLTLPDNSGAKSLIEARLAETASIAFEEGAVDIDTPEDFERLNQNRD
jgi:molybdenum cofactor cytidylyltransferase